ASSHQGANYPLDTRAAASSRAREAPPIDEAQWRAGMLLVFAGEMWQASIMFSRRLPHVVTRKDLALLIAATYAASASVDFEEAHERMERAVTSDRISDQLYAGLSAALYERKGPRTTEEAL